ALALLGLRLRHGLDVSTEILPWHDLLDRFQRIAQSADRLQPALNIEKALLPHDPLAPSALTACGHRVRFAATWREEFFEVPLCAVPNAEHPRWQQEQLNFAERGRARPVYTERSYRQLLEPLGYHIDHFEGIGGPLLVFIQEKIGVPVRRTFGEVGASLVALIAIPFVWGIRFDIFLGYHHGMNDNGTLSFTEDLLIDSGSVAFKYTPSSTPASFN